MVHRGPQARTRGTRPRLREGTAGIRYRLRVKGGLTGYAQIYGKYNTSAYDKLRLDLLYIENQSIWMDLKMILLTIKVLFIPESTEGFRGGEEQEDA